jgi:hypothetical protein
LKKLTGLLLVSWLSLGLIKNTYCEVEVEALSDLEGNKNRLDDFLSQSENLTLDEKGRLKVKEGAHFVYVGDVMDRGPNSRKILEMLVDLKERQPHQVTLIAGNRDINKIRLTLELNDEALFRKRSERSKFPYFIGNSGAATYNSQADTKINRLKWMLSETLGAKHAFELRRKELSSANAALVNDEEVYKSMLSDVEAGGPMEKYLERAELSKIIDGNMFIHGAFNDEAYYALEKEFAQGSLRKNLEELNKKYKAAVDDYKKGKSTALTDWLIAYQEPNKITPGRNNVSLVYSYYFVGDEQPEMPTLETQDKIKSEGIHRILGGHSPQGSEGTLMKSNILEIVVMDNSYASHDRANLVRVQAQNMNMKGYEEGLGEITTQTKVGERSFLGKLTQDGFIVVGKTSDGHYFAKKRLPKHKIDTTLFTKEELDKMTLQIPQKSRLAPEFLVQCEAML